MGVEFNNIVLQKNKEAYFEEGEDMEPFGPHPGTSVQRKENPTKHQFMGNFLPNF